MAVRMQLKTVINAIIDRLAAKKMIRLCMPRVIFGGKTWPENTISWFQPE